MLRFGFAKAKFTANATYRQTLADQAAQAVKAEAVLTARQHLAVVAAMKEAANVVENAEAIVNQAATAEADQAVVTHAAVVAAVIVPAAVAAEVVPVDKVVVTVRVAEIVPAAQERDNC